MRGAPRQASIQTRASNWRQGRTWSLASFAAWCLLGAIFLFLPVLSQGRWVFRTSIPLGCLSAPFLPLPWKVRPGTILSFDVSGVQAKQPQTAREEDGFGQAAAGETAFQIPGSLHGWLLRLPCRCGTRRAWAVQGPLLRHGLVCSRGAVAAGFLLKAAASGRREAGGRGSIQPSATEAEAGFI